MSPEYLGDVAVRDAATPAGETPALPYCRTFRVTVIVSATYLPLSL
jgi:hypothetical protein